MKFGKMPKLVKKIDDQSLQRASLPKISSNNSNGGNKLNSTGNQELNTPDKNRS